MHWCPTGSFTFLPLHAAGIYPRPTRCVSDYVVWSYTPTLGALLKARDRLLAPPRAGARVLLVAEPSAPNMPFLPEATVEIETIAKMLSLNSTVTSLGGTATRATVANVESSLPGTSVLHMACHGYQDAANAVASGFCLRDGNLTVERLMRLDLGDALLAVLSACETAKGHEAQPDQMVHLAAAMLFVGFRSVIGTMW